MKRPGVVWIYAVLVVLNILMTLGGGMSSLASLGPLPGLMKYVIYASFVLIIPEIVFIYLFFMLKKSSLLWLYISFGLGIVLSLVAMNWLTAVVYAVFGWVVWDYISHKQIDGKDVFT